MRRRLAIAAAFILAAGVLAGPRAPSRAQGLSQLLVYPSEGHSGDRIYLSGSGLLPNRRLSLVIGCPTIVSPDAHKYHNFLFQIGPTTDPHGNFEGFRMKKFVLHGVPSATCRVYENDGEREFGPDIVGLYTVIPPDEPLKKCDRNICGLVRTHPKKVRAGLIENVDISNGWGGAVAQVSVSFADGSIFGKTVKLDYLGRGHLKLAIPRGVQPSKAQVDAKFTLGPYRGERRTIFTIFR